MMFSLIMTRGYIGSSVPLPFMALSVSASFSPGAQSLLTQTIPCFAQTLVPILPRLTMYLWNFLRSLLSTLSAPKISLWLLTSSLLTVIYALYVHTSSGLRPELVHLTFQPSDSVLAKLWPLVISTLSYASGSRTTLTIQFAQSLAILSGPGSLLSWLPWGSLTKISKQLGDGLAEPLNSIANFLGPNATLCLRHLELLNSKRVNCLIYSLCCSMLWLSTPR